MFLLGWGWGGCIFRPYVCHLREELSPQVITMDVDLAGAGADGGSWEMQPGAFGQPFGGGS